MTAKEFTIIANEIAKVKNEDERIVIMNFFLKVGKELNSKFDRVLFIKQYRKNI